MTTTTCITNNQSRNAVQVEEEDDEFFGCQSDDEDDKNSTPAMSAAASIFPRTTSVSVSVVSTDALGQQETKSQEEHFWKIGYHETHENYSHEKLQEGFEFGYRNSIEGSIRLGELLGRHACRHPVMAVNGDGSANGSGGAPVRILKGYLEKEQVKDAMDMDTESIKHGMDQVEQHLHLAST